MTVHKIPLDKDKLLRLLKILRNQEISMGENVLLKDWLELRNKIRNVQRSLAHA